MVVVRFIIHLIILIGAWNWGLWGFFQYDLIADIFGGPLTGWARFCFAIIGLAGIYGISFFWTGVCTKGGGGSCHQSSGDNNQPPPQQ